MNACARRALLSCRVQHSPNWEELPPHLRLCACSLASFTPTAIPTAAAAAADADVEGSKAFPTGVNDALRKCGLRVRCGHSVSGGACSGSASASSEGATQKRDMSVAINNMMSAGNSGAIRAGAVPAAGAAFVAAAAAAPADDDEL